MRLVGIRTYRFHLPNVYSGSIKNLPPSGMPEDGFSISSPKPIGVQCSDGDFRLGSKR